MSKPLTTAGTAALGKNPYNRLVAETEHLLHRQRKKGPEYKVIVDSKKKKEEEEYLQKLLYGDVEEESPGTNSPTKNVASPRKEGTAKGGVSMDAYDPKEVAARELEALTDEVTKARNEASKLKKENEMMRERQVKLVLDERQLKNADTVEQDRVDGLAGMLEKKEILSKISESINETEQYSKTLMHMLRRSEDEKLSEMAQLKAFEEGLAVHRQELDLADDVMRQVGKSRDDELRALQKLHSDLRKAITTLDKKLEFRRVEVKIRQDKAKYRLLKLQEEIALKSAAEGLLTPEQEMAMVEKARQNALEAESLRSEKMAAQTEADQLEAEFNAIRFAAGGREQATNALSPGGKKEEAEDFTRPDPEPIIMRLAQLEEELVAIDDTLRENNSLLSIQTKQRGVLSVIKQPKARDASDETDKDLEQFERLESRILEAKRQQEGSQRDLEVARFAKLHLEQSISNLFDRVNALPIHDVRAPNSRSQQIFNRTMTELEGLSEQLPSPWSRNQARRAAFLMQKFATLLHLTDPDSAVQGAIQAGEAWEKSFLGRQALSTRTEEDSLVNEEKGAEGENGEDKNNEKAAAAAAAEETRSDAPGEDDDEGEKEDLPPAADAEKAAADKEKLMEATIESLLVSNEWSVRVRPGSSGPSRPYRNISGKNLGEAVAAFERTWRGVAGAPDAAPVPDSSDPYGAEASQLRRKSLSEEIAGGYATIAAFSGLVDPSQVDSAKADAPLDPSSKPKARDIQRFLAVAAAMVGDELEEGALLPQGAGNQARKDAAKELDSMVHLRENIKRDGAHKLKAHQQETARLAAALAEEELKQSKR